MAKAKAPAKKTAAKAAPAKASTWQEREKKQKEKVEAQYGPLVNAATTVKTLKALAKKKLSYEEKRHLESLCHKRAVKLALCWGCGAPAPARKPVPVGYSSHKELVCDGCEEKKLREALGESLFRQALGWHLYGGASRCPACKEEIPTQEQLLKHDCALTKRLRQELREDQAWQAKLEEALTNAWSRAKSQAKHSRESDKASCPSCRALVPLAEVLAHVCGAAPAEASRVELVAISRITAAKETQSRAALSTPVAEEYRKVLARGEELPPVDLFREGQALWLADGFHRRLAYLAEARTELPAVMHEGTARDAYLFGMAKNRRHGYQPTLADKRAAAEGLLRDDEWRRWSNREIARRSGLDHEAVQALREKIAAETGEVPQAERKVKRGDKEYTQKVKEKKAPKKGEHLADPPDKRDLFTLGKSETEEEGEELCARCEEPYEAEDLRLIDGAKVCYDCVPPTEEEQLTLAGVVDPAEQLAALEAERRRVFKEAEVSEDPDAYAEELAELDQAIKRLEAKVAKREAAAGTLFAVIEEGQGGKAPAEGSATTATPDLAAARNPGEVAEAMGAKLAREGKPLPPAPTAVVSSPFREAMQRGHDAERARQAAELERVRFFAVFDFLARDAKNPDDGRPCPACDVEVLPAAAANHGDVCRPWLTARAAWFRESGITITEATAKEALPAEASPAITTSPATPAADDELPRREDGTPNIQTIRALLGGPAFEKFFSARVARALCDRVEDLERALAAAPGVRAAE